IPTEINDKSYSKFKKNVHKALREWESKIAEMNLEKSGSRPMTLDYEIAKKDAINKVRKRLNLAVDLWLWCKTFGLIILAGNPNFGIEFWEKNLNKSSYLKMFDLIDSNTQLKLDLQQQNDNHFLSIYQGLKGYADKLNLNDENLVKKLPTKPILFEAPDQLLIKSQSANTESHFKSKPASFSPIFNSSTSNNRSVPYFIDTSNTHTDPYFRDTSNTHTDPYFRDTSEAGQGDIEMEEVENESKSFHKDYKDNTNEYMTRKEINQIIQETEAFRDSEKFCIVDQNIKLKELCDSVNSKISYLQQQILTNPDLEETQFQTKIEEIQSSINDFNILFYENWIIELENKKYSQKTLEQMKQKLEQLKNELLELDIADHDMRNLVKINVDHIYKNICEEFEETNDCGYKTYHEDIKNSLLSFNKTQNLILKSLYLPTFLDDMNKKSESLLNQYIDGWSTCREKLGNDYENEAKSIDIFIERLKKQPNKLQVLKELSSYKETVNKTIENKIKPKVLNKLISLREITISTELSIDLFNAASKLKSLDKKLGYVLEDLKTIEEITIKKELEDD
ncbi:1808_t:CDS:2, partial [Cetraspora pellucida]